MLAEEKWPAAWEEFNHEHVVDCLDRDDVVAQMAEWLSGRIQVIGYHREFSSGGGLLYPWDQEESSYSQKALHFTYVF